MCHLTEWLQLNKLGLQKAFWHDLKRRIHTRHSKDIGELKQFTTQHYPKHFCYQKRLKHFLNPQGLQTFTTLRYECLHVVVNKNMETCNFLCGIS